MKRYTMTNLPSGHVEPVETDDGEWVRWEDLNRPVYIVEMAQMPDNLRASVEEWHKSARGSLVRWGHPVEKLSVATWPSERRGLRVSEDER